MSTTYFLWDEADQNIIEEYEGNFDKTVEYTHEPGLYGGVISQHRSDLTSFYHEDALGSTVALTDESEEVTDSYAYDAWGNEVSHTGTTENPFRWNGQAGYYYKNPENYFVRHRVYQPTVARWHSVDPAGFLDGINLYLYVFNCPLNRVDASGLQSGILYPPDFNPAAPAFDECASIPVEYWTPRACDLYPCENCKCTDTKQPDDFSLRDLFNDLKNQTPNLECLAFFTIDQVTVNVRNGRVGVRPGNCAPGADRPLALTCPFVDKNGNTAAAVCLPEGAWSYCDARSILLHELQHVQDICTGAEAARTPAENERVGYTTQCNAMADHRCIFGDNRSQFIQECLIRFGGVSGGGNRQPIIRGCRNLLNNIRPDRRQ